jgi:hypothetical protein
LATVRDDDDADLKCRAIWGATLIMHHTLDLVATEVASSSSVAIAPSQHELLFSDTLISIIELIGSSQDVQVTGAALESLRTFAFRASDILVSQ